MTRRYSILLTIMAIALLRTGPASAADGMIRVGTYDNPPKVFRDSLGNVDGFYVRLVKAILSMSARDCVFIHGTWMEGLERLESGQIDLLVDVAYSDERAQVFRFNEETVFVNWGVVYVRQDRRVESFLDLDGLTLAGMRGGIHSEGAGGIVSLAKRFGITIHYLPLEDYTAAFRAVAERKADAAVVNRLFGLAQEDEWNLRRTSVIFNPIELKFAFNRDSPKTPELAAMFDKGLRALKADPRSVFYSAMEEYIPGFLERKPDLPPWLRVAIPVAVLALAIAIGFVGILWGEVRRRRSVEAELRIAKDAADSANRAKSSFLATMSHEIRTPLNAVLGYAQILGADPALSREQRGYLDRILSSGRHLLYLINGILDISRIETGHESLKDESVDLLSLLYDVESMVRPKADAKGLVLYTEILDSLPRLARTDEGKLRQILLNLLGNAVKFTPTGKVVLSASAEPTPDGDGLLDAVFTVTDTGPGIEASDRERIFEPFEQAQAGKVVREGTGLGLSISRRYARMMGGDIGVSLPSGGGSEFSLRIRLSPEKSDAGDAPRGRFEAGGGVPRRSSPGQPAPMAAGPAPRPEELRAEAARLDDTTRQALARALAVGDVGRVRELAGIMAPGNPLLADAALRASESFDLNPLIEALGEKG